MVIVTSSTPGTVSASARPRTARSVPARGMGSISTPAAHASRSGRTASPAPAWAASAWRKISSSRLSPVPKRNAFEHSPPIDRAATSSPYGPPSPTRSSACSGPSRRPSAAAARPAVAAIAARVVAGSRDGVTYSVSSKYGPSSGSGLSNRASTRRAPSSSRPSRATSGPGRNDSTSRWVCPAPSAASIAAMRRKAGGGEALAGDVLVAAGPHGGDRIVRQAERLGGDRRDERRVVVHADHRRQRPRGREGGDLAGGAVGVAQVERQRRARRVPCQRLSPLGAHHHGHAQPSRRLQKRRRPIGPRRHQQQHAGRWTYSPCPPSRCGKGGRRRWSGAGAGAVPLAPSLSGKGGWGG